MLLLIPVFLLILAAVVIQVFGRTRFNIAQTWIFAIVISSATWIYFIVLRIIEPATLSINYLETGNINDVKLLINFNQETWVFGFLLLTIVGGILLSDAGRLTDKNNLVIWSGTMFITAAGIFACMSESLVIFFFASTFLDVSLIIIQLAVNPGNDQHRSIMLEFMMRVAGTLILITVLGNAGFSSNGQLIEIQNGILPLIIIGMILRLGVFHPREWSEQPVAIRSNLQVLTQLVVPITMFAFISRLSTPSYADFPYTLTYIVIILITFFRAGSLFARPVITRRIWVDTISGLGIGLFLIGGHTAILPLGIVMATFAGAISITDSRSRWTNYFLLALMLGLIGLPVTPTHGLWITPPETDSPFLTFLYSTTLMVAIVGVSSKFLQTYNQKLSTERWIDLSNNLSPIILMVAPWVFLPWAGNLSGSQLGLVIAVIIILITILRLLFSKWLSDFTQRLQTSAKNITSSKPILWNYIKDFFQLKWFFNILKTFNAIGQWLVTTMIRVLEGEGGLLWALVFLILITSIIMTYRLAL